MQNNGIHGIPAIARAAAWCALLLLAALLLSSPFPPPLHAQTNNDPYFPSDEEGLRKVAENTPAGRNIGAPIAATDDDGDPLTYSITGHNADLFQIVPSTGQLRTRSRFNFEQLDHPAFVFTLEVHDGKDANGQPDDTLDVFISVQINIENVDEPGSLTILPTQPYVASVVRARIVDPDGVLDSAQWEWSRSRSSSGGWSTIEDAVTNSYIPRPADAGMHLRVRATYFDHATEFAEPTTLVRVSARAGAEKTPRPVKVEEVVTGLSIPWDLAFTPDGTMLFTQRGGHISARRTNGTEQPIMADMTDLSKGQEAGLMSIVVDPSFSSNRRFYTCQAHTDGPIGDETDEDDEVQVIAWTVNAGYTAATRANNPLVGGIPSNSMHSGCRLRFGPDGYLWITTGDALEGGHPQDLMSLGGKVLRVNAATGEGAPGNPFSASGSPPGSPLVYTYGHRNVQGLARRPGTRQMWSVEHGPDRDDEINVLVPGRNYGWDPRSGDDYSEHDDFVPMTDTEKYPDAVEAKWSSGYPTIAASGGVFLEGSNWGPWNGMLAVASLRDRTLRVFDFDSGGRLRSEFVVPELDHAYGLNYYGRLRSPVMGPDGSLYVTTSQGGGMDAILKVTPVAEPRFPYHRPLHRTVRTGAPAGSNAGAPVTARRIGGGRLTYSLGGPDEYAFDINPSSGHLQTNAHFDSSTEGVQYKVEVSVHDGSPDTTIDDTVEVLITVEGRPRPPPPPPPTNNGGGFGGFGPAPVAPKFAEGFRTEREAFENAKAGDPVGEPVIATHPDDLGITYSLSGEDAALFAVDEDTGQVRVREGVDLTLGDSYSVNVTATDTAGTGTIIIVEIAVTEAPYHAYDANRNGVIDFDEVLAAVNDYFAGDIEEDEVIEVINLYFDDS